MKTTHMQDVMLDLETLGCGPRAVILSIGAVYFAPGIGLGDEFYARVDAESCVRAGLVMDVSTVLWWMEQSTEARLALVHDREGEPLKEALCRFSHFLGVGWGMEADDVRVWGNGAAFDNVILASAYRALKQPAPWKFWNDCCYRTMKRLHPHVRQGSRTGTHHHALEDAKTQALHACEILAGPTRAPVLSAPTAASPRARWERFFLRLRQRLSRPKKNFAPQPLVSPRSPHHCR